MIAGHNLYLRYRTTGCGGDVVKPLCGPSILGRSSCKCDISRHDDAGGTTLVQITTDVSDVVDETVLNVIMNSDFAAPLLSEMNV